MNKERKRNPIKMAILIILSILLICIFVVAAIIISGNIKYKKYLKLNDTELTAKLIKSRFILGTPLTEEELLSYTPKEMVSLLNDNYSEYLTKDEFQLLIDDLNEKYVGIGFQSNKVKGEVLEILSVMPDSPALRVGLKSGDKIFKIDGKDTIDMDRTETTSLIRGEIGTKVTLTVLRGNQMLDMEIERKQIDSKNVISKMLDEDIGYIYISQFPLDAAEDYLSELENLQNRGMKKLILDLRGNSGGELQEIIPIASSLLDESIIDMYSVKYKDGESERYMRETSLLFSGPVVILCNKGTASASELLIAILKDYERVTTIGEKTFGKQISQEFIHLNDGNVLKLSTGLFTSPKNSNFNITGLTPDILIKNTSFNEDIQLRKAIEYLNK